MHQPRTDCTGCIYDNRPENSPWAGWESRSNLTRLPWWKIFRKPRNPNRKICPNLGIGAFKVRTPNSVTPHELQNVKSLPRLSCETLCALPQVAHWDCNDPIVARSTIGNPLFILSLSPFLHACQSHIVGYQRTLWYELLRLASMIVQESVSLTHCPGDLQPERAKVRPSSCKLWRKMKVSLGINSYCLTIFLKGMHKQLSWLLGSHM